MSFTLKKKNKNSLVGNLEDGSLRCYFRMYVDRITKTLQRILETVWSWYFVSASFWFIYLGYSYLLSSVVFFSPFFSKQYFIIRWKGLSVFNLCYTENYSSFLSLSLTRDLICFLVYEFPMSMHVLGSFSPSKLNFQSAC